MKLKARHIAFLSALLALMFASTAAFAAGGGGAAPIVIVADTRHLSGIMLWWASLYNESHAQFTALTVVLIPAVGLIFGLLADVFMGWLGIDLKNRNVSEH